MQPTPVFLLGNSHGQRSLADYSPWSHKESDRTEHNSVPNILECGCLRLPLILQFAGCATLSKLYIRVRTNGLKSRVHHSQVGMQRSVFFFLLGYHCFAVLRSFLLYNEVIQLYVHTHALPLRPPAATRIPPL